MTNDGELTNRLLHPSHQVDKTYLATVDSIPATGTLNKLRQGVQLADGITAPAQVQIKKRSAKGALLEIKIHEGRNRQVRRMLDAVGYPVRHLRRSAFAFLNLDGLKPGEWRELNDYEIRQLKEILVFGGWQNDQRRINPNLYRRRKRQKHSRLWSKLARCRLGVVIPLSSQFMKNGKKLRRDHSFS